ncbi:MAG TPA: UbiX family flavin prenyltransferase [Thermoplasmata archaeon]|nr:UbiX family flavin prenyltransferase [Thermoplasmata archaeon]
MAAQLPVVVGVSGASGAPIAVRVLDALKTANVPVALVVSDGAVAVLREECGLAPEALARLADQTYSDHDLAAPIASGSSRTRGMVIVPCSSNTVARVALGLGDTLLTRAAHVHLKERRRLVIVPRESPLPTTMLRYLTTLSELGVVVLDAAPPYYLHPKSVDEQTAYLAGKVLDHLEVPHQLYRGWKAGGG